MITVQERPCARCIKRNIGHLCHDEPREPEANMKKRKGSHSNSAEDDTTPPKQSQSSNENGVNSPFDRLQEHSQDAVLGPGTAAVAPGTTGGPVLVQPSPVSVLQANALNHNSQCKILLAAGSASHVLTHTVVDFSSDWTLGTQSQFEDMHNYHPSYMFNAPEVTTEYNLLNDFLNNSLLDDGALLSDENPALYSNAAAIMQPNNLNKNAPSTSGAQNNTALAQLGNPSAISRPASVLPTDKAREYYLQAADPTGNDAPEERMQRLLRAKYDAGMLKPFNYVKGYARLSAYMDGHMNVSSKQKILRQLERFRPKFREKVQALTDIELIYVEMWFERSLMEYDRVFASMAIPACLWRRTGEIFRGNKEMAELIHVPIEKLRDVCMHLPATQYRS